MKPITVIVTGLLVLIAVGHVLRLMLGLEVTVGGGLVPMWVSVLGTIVAAGLAVGLWREHRAPRAP